LEKNLSDTQKDFNQNYLAEKLQTVGEKLDDPYGRPLMDELITRMERTVSHFNEEVDLMLKTLSSRTKNQKGLLATMRGEDPNQESIELSELEKKLELDDNNNPNSVNSTVVDKPIKKKFSLFGRKNKK